MHEPCVVSASNSATVHPPRIYVSRDRTEGFNNVGDMLDATSLDCIFGLDTEELQVLRDIP